MDTNPLPQLPNDMQFVCNGEQPPGNQDWSQNEEGHSVDIVSTCSSTALNVLNSILLGDDYSKRPAQLPTYSSTVQGVILVNTLVGSYGLQAWDCSEAILCSITGTPSGSTLFKLAKSKFRKHQGHPVTILKATKKATQIFELAIGGVRFQIEYCQVAFTTESRIFDVLSAVQEDAKMPSLTSTKLKSYGIAAYLASHIPDMAIFQQSYRQIKEWAIRQGIYSAQFWYLNESQLLIMVAAVCQNNTMTTVERVLQVFFDLYDDADLATEFPCDEHVYSRLHEDADKPGRKFNTACPWLRLSDYTTKQTLQTVANCIHNMRSIISTKDPSSIQNSLESCDGLADFASNYSAYIKVEISYWGPSQPTLARYVAHIASTVANWVTTHTHSSSLLARAWPYRLTHPTSSPSPASYEAFYLIGVISTPSSLPTSTERLRTTIINHPTFNAHTMFTSVETLDRLPSTPLIPDPTTLPLVPPSALPPSTSTSSPSSSRSSSPEPPLRAPPTLIPRAPHHPPTPSSARLRPALDILHRIRHDAAMDSADYVIGYVDRHAGIKEMPVGWWRSEATEEEFVPQSRIRYFKRVSDGERVWDREGRVDGVFGSGVGRGGGV